MIPLLRVATIAGAIAATAVIAFADTTTTTVKTARLTFIAASPGVMLINTERLAFNKSPNGDTTVMDMKPLTFIKIVEGKP